MHYDVFNGDADGVIALLQLRLAQPKPSRLISGVKRDIALLKQVVGQDSITSVTVLDVSMETNQIALRTLLEAGVAVFYCDHHRAGHIPESELLESLLCMDADTCTSLLINEKLEGRYVHWAIAAAFGDNLHASAQVLADKYGVNESDQAFLRQLGTLINYNAYGASLRDLHIPPVQLYQQLLAYRDPFALRTDPNSPYFILHEGYQQDCRHLAALSPVTKTEYTRVFELPNAAWARRMSGVFSNQLANQIQNQAHAVLTLNPTESDYTVSVRAPLANREGADEVCQQFFTGGGRRGAAGINTLPLADKSKFIRTFCDYYDK
ncbi:DHH family phosphoesterase [Vibrio profundum]|uniref:DHH family phosphoesterase n=1 Tax=Vibrio profundum TaxID=2910247 RepID=UPI003D11EB9F